MFALSAAPVGAQGADTRPARRGEARIDVIAGSRSLVHAGVGVELPVGSYARVEAVLAAGPRLGAGGPEFSARADGLVRFVLDPAARRTRTPYVGAGLSVVAVPGATEPNVVALLGLQLAARRAFLPAVELGFGRGVRVGFVLRQTP